MSNAQRRREKRAAEKLATRRAIEVQFGMKPGTLNPARPPVYVGAMISKRPPVLYNRWGYPRCYA